MNLLDRLLVCITMKQELLTKLKEFYPNHDIDYKYWVVCNQTHCIVITVFNSKSKKLTRLISNQSLVSEEEAVRYLLEQLC